MLRPASNWTYSAGDRSFLASPASVHCVHAGELRLRAAAGKQPRSLMVRCRPVQGFRHMPVLEFFVGDAGQSWSVGPIGSDGTTEELIAGRAALLDTSIARLSEGRVHPVKPGSTTLLVQFGDGDIHIPVEVLSRATSTRDVTASSQFVEAFRLRAMEARAWPLRNGQFNIMLRTAAYEEDVDLHVTDARCYPLRRESRALTCAATDSSLVVVSRRGRERRTTMNEHEIQIAEAPKANVRPRASEVERRRRQSTLCPWTP